MKRYLLSLAMLTITGCSESNLENQTSENAESSDRQVISHPVAVLSCAVNGTPLGVSACFMSGQDGMGGSLKITNRGVGKQYTTADFAAENGLSWTIPLTEASEVIAQARGDSGYVLRLTVRDGSKTVFQDETTEFGIVQFDNLR